MMNRGAKKEMAIEKKGLSSVQGFKFSGVSLESGRKNCGLIFSGAEHTLGTAVYTKNDIQAAPVVISRKMDIKSNVKQAIIVNSGNANAFTGKQGLLDAETCIHELTRRLNIQPAACYIASTGVIGRKLNTESIINRMESLISELSEEGDSDFAEAILTTDTRPKQLSVKFEIAGRMVTIAACAKGAGMIMPDMATMLCFIITDASISHTLMQRALKDAVDDTLNCITVDGDTSTNDTVFMLANGMANNRLIEKDDETYSIFFNNLRGLLEQIAIELIGDAEGITKLITIEVINASNKEKAKIVALSVANSPLVKTAFYGEQLNWGRIIMAIGKAGIGVDASSIDISINNFEIVTKGEPQSGSESYLNAEKSLKNKQIFISINLNQGKDKAKVWTSDLSLEYVKINANYIS